MNHHRLGIVPHPRRKIRQRHEFQYRTCKARVARTLLSACRRTKWDIFHYIDTVLHHPEYRERYAANLRRELPRIPNITDWALEHESRSVPPAAGLNKRKNRGNESR
jgi:predicted helicase